MTKAITPKEAQERAIKEIPDYVYEAFNEFLVRGSGTGSPSVKVTLKEAVELIIEKSKKQGIQGVDHKFLLNRGYLDIEKAYKEAGWNVIYDKPGYNESYDSYYQFTKATS